MSDIFVKDISKVISKEQLIERCLSKLIKENTGTGPVNTKVSIFEKVVVCRFEGFLTKADEFIIKSGQPEKIIEYRSRYVTQCIDEIDKLLKEIVNKKIKYFFPSWIPEENLACWTIFLE